MSETSPEPVTVESVCKQIDDLRVKANHLIDGIRAQRDALDIALRRYGQHESDCASRIPYDPARGFERRPCSCGYSAALRWKK